MNDGSSALISQMAAIVEQFDRRCEQSSRELQQLTQQVPGLVQQSTNEQMQRIPAQVMGHVRGGIEQPVAAYEQRLRAASEQLQEASRSLATQLQRSEVLHRHLVWKVAGTVLGSLLLLLVGGIWLSKHYYTEIRQNQISAELLKAYNQADVQLCEGRLCAKVDSADKRFGEYRPVKAR